MEKPIDEKKKNYLYMGFRPTKETLRLIDLITKEYPDAFPNKSALIRAGIHYLYNFKLKNGGSPENELLQN